jgi:hypothetical protein
MHVELGHGVPNLTDEERVNDVHRWYTV